jgi:hypothetical protein
MSNKDVLSKLIKYFKNPKNFTSTMRIGLSSNLRKKCITSWYLLTVFIGFILIGWLLNGLQASLMACVGTLTVSLYLIWVGLGGVALASVWVVGLMSVAAIHQLWFHDLPRPEFRYIPMILLANWLFVLGVTWQLGKISDRLQKTRISRIFGFAGLVGLVAISVTVGWQLYPQTLLLISSF